jgi:hypothetical protein
MAMATAKATATAMASALAMATATASALVTAMAVATAMAIATATATALSMAIGECSNDGCSNVGDNNYSIANFSDVGVHPISNADFKCPDVASTKADKERELLLLQALAYIKIARAQRALYQVKVADVVADATARKDYSVRRYTFVVDYWQNMELPVYNKEQPGCTYNFSPMSIYNLGVVNHTHIYNDRWVSEHLHCHAYTEGVGK